LGRPQPALGGPNCPQPTLDLHSSPQSPSSHIDHTRRRLSPKGPRRPRRRKSAESRTQFITPRADRIPGWSFALWFVGRTRGREALRWFGRVREGTCALPFGSILQAVRAGVVLTGIPAMLWTGPVDVVTLGLVLDAWPWTATRRGPRDRARIIGKRGPLPIARLETLFNYTPGFIQIQPKVAFTGSVDQLRTLRVAFGLASQGRQAGEPLSPRAAQAFSEFLAYQAEHSLIVHVWYAQSLEAAAWCEILWAWENRATTRRCTVCSMLFLRPRTFKGERCPLCRTLKWRRLARICRAPLEQQRVLAHAAYVNSGAEYLVTDTIPQEAYEAFRRYLEAPRPLR
jgi:hypothetical protein